MLRASSLSCLACVLAGCLSVQDFEGGDVAPPAAAGEPPADPSLGAPEARPASVPEWQWYNPAPTGRTLLGVGGTSDSDVWVVGEGGTIAHYDGARWDLRRSPREAAGARYFAVGARAKDDAWFAGENDGKIEVLHFDGEEWTKSYPFAGSSFGGFSHGPGDRLFAFVDWEVLELEGGTWKPTDTSENLVFGPPADVWVGASGEAWIITTGAKLLRLAPGAKRWTLQPKLAEVPSGAVGLGIAGSGSTVCAFYTGRASGAGFLRYDGAWHASPTSSDPLPLGSDRHGARVGCLADGTGVMTYDGDVVVASQSSAPAITSMSHFPGERLYGAWSRDGSKVYAVGSLGAFLVRDSGAQAWREKGSTRRRDLLAVDVGLDGAVVAVDAAEPDRRHGGEVLFTDKGAFAPYEGGGIQGPSIPVGVAAVAADDVWALANDGSIVGVAHWTGRWSVTRTLAAGGSALREALAIWAPAKDDVWATATRAVWHYDGSTWSAVATDATYRSIHGTGPRDVWFAGEGLAHWDGKTLTRLASPAGSFAGVWSSAPGRVWLWGERALLFDGKTSTPVEVALSASTEWVVTGIAEAASGDVFVLTKEAAGTSLLWFDASRTKLLDVVSSDLELTAIRGRGDRLWAIGAGGACLGFGPTVVR